MEDNTPIKWAYPFKSSSVSADGASSDTNNPELYFQALAQAKDGFYPMGASGLWHGGVHFDEGTADTLEQSSVRCIADGEVIAYRIDKLYPKTLYSRSAGSGSRGVEKDFSTGFVLIKHKLQPPPPPAPTPTSGTPAAAPATTPTLTFYSLYMHLLDWKGYQASSAPQPPLFISEPLYSVKASKATSPLAGLRVREQANSSSTVLAILPKGCRIKLGDADSAHPNWRKLVSIIEGCSIPALSGEGERWVYAKETEETGIADIRLVADRANDTELTLGTPPKGLKIYKEGNASSKVIGLLPAGVTFSLESGNSTYRKLKAITSGQDIPPLTANCAQNVLGYVAFDELEVADKTTPILDEVHLLDPAIDIKAGELIGHIGQYQNFDDALPRPMLHLQVFTCDALPAFISQCQELAKQLPKEQKNLAMVNVGTKMVSPPAADTSVAAEHNVRICNDSPKEGCWAKVQQYVELKAKKAGFGSFDNVHNRYPMDATKKNELAGEFALDVAELPDTVDFLLESYKDDGSDMYPGKNNIPATHTRRKVGVLLKTPLWVEREKLNPAGQRTSTSGELPGWQNFPLSNSLDGELCGYNRVLPRSVWSSLDQKHKAIAPDNIRWWYVTVADAHGKDISGWVPEQDLILSLHSPWEWPGFSYVEDIQPLDAQLARQLNADGGLRGAEAERYLAQIDAAERGDILNSLYDIIDLPNERNQRDQKLSADELKTALGKPWLAQQLSLLITHFESEWYWSESKWNALDTLMAPTPGQPNPIWEAEKTRIKALSWWKKLADEHEINTNGKVWHFHPAGLIGNFFKEPTCNCNLEVKVTKSGTVYGPIHWGTTKLGQATIWPELIASGTVTEDEVEIISKMADNEGNIEAVQSYDSEVITAGAMQKTVNPLGSGEFPIQVRKFKDSNPSLYVELFEKTGWYLDTSSPTPKMYYQNSNWGDGEKLEGTALRSSLRNDCSALNFTKVINHPPIASIACAISHPEFIKIQAIDFVDRLRFVLNQRPNGYTFTVKELFKSKLGKAVALDQSVNRPAHVPSDLKTALDAFHSAHPSISMNISSWGAEHSNYELEIIELYGNNRDMTHGDSRFQSLKERF